MTTVHAPAPRRPTQGFAVLVTIIVMALVMGIIALTASRTGIMEHKIAGNDIRAREAQEAAQAGLEHAISWAANNTVNSGTPITITVPVTGFSSGETYTSTVVLTRLVNSIQVSSRSQANSDNTIFAEAQTQIKQVTKQLFAPGAPTPPPWVLAGCVTTAPTGTPDAFVLSSTGSTAISGTSAAPSCMQQGHLGVSTWSDANNNGVQDSGEVGWEDTNHNGVQDSGENRPSTPFNTAVFSGCPATNCTWNHAFDMALSEAKATATTAGHVFNSSIPCGAPAIGQPSIYIVNNGGPINGADISGSCSGTGVTSSTIGTPGKPIVLIIPSSAGCPKFNGGITIYGIVYYETPTACASNGWGGATVYGSVLWEGNVDKPNANSKFIEVDYEKLGDLNEVFGVGVDSVTSIPGTWKDF